MSNTSYIINQKINNIRSFIDNNTEVEEVSLRSDLQANEFNIEGVTVLQSHFIETNSLNSTETQAPLSVLADTDFQSTANILNANSISSNGYIGKHVPLTNIFIASGITDGENQTYQWGQRYVLFTPLYPDSWGLSLRNICLNCKGNSHLAIRIIPTSNAATSTYVRREMNTLGSGIKIQNAALIRLHSLKFKGNSSVRVQIEGCRLLNDNINHTYGKTKLILRVYGTDIDDEEVYNEISAYIDDEIDNVNTDYMIEIYSMAQYSCTGDAWLFENGNF